MSPENIFGGWHFIIIAFPRVYSSDTRSRSFQNLPSSINNPNNRNRSFETKRIFYQLTDTGWNWPSRPTWTSNSPQLPSLTTRVKRGMWSVFHGSSYAAEALEATNVPFP